MPDDRHADDRRDVVVAFRLTRREAAHVDAAGRALRQSRSRADFCRAVALAVARQRVPPPTKPVRRPARRRPAMDVQLLSRLLAAAGKLGGNVNQLARVANSSGALPAAAMLASIAAEVTALRDGLVAALGGGDAGGGGTP